MCIRDRFNIFHFTRWNQFTLKEIVNKILVWLMVHFFLCPSSCACFSVWSIYVFFHYLTIHRCYNAQTPISITAQTTANYSFTTNHPMLYQQSNNNTCLIMLLYFHLISPASYYNIASGCLLKKSLLCFSWSSNNTPIFSQYTRIPFFRSVSFISTNHWYKQTEKTNALNRPQCFVCLMSSSIYCPKRNILQRKTIG